MPDLIRWDEEGRAPEGAAELMKKARLVLSPEEAEAEYRQFMIFMGERIKVQLGRVCE